MKCSVCFTYKQGNQTHNRSFIKLQQNNKICLAMKPAFVANISVMVLVVVLSFEVVSTTPVQDVFYLEKDYLDQYKSGKNS